TASMMEEGSTKRTVEELQATLDKLGSSVSISAGSYTTDISISTLDKNLPQTLAIVQEVLFEPKFDEQDFERVKQQMLEGIVYQHQQP
ncbi:insulinase family protein, partial [Vibrio sp. 10N.222.55.E8]